MTLNHNEVKKRKKKSRLHVVVLRVGDIVIKL